MADNIRRKRLKDQDRNEERDGIQYFHRVYEITRNSTLAEANLELGDALPEDADAEITVSLIRVDPPKGAKGLQMGANAQFAHVTARKVIAWRD